MNDAENDTRELSVTIKLTKGVLSIVVTGPGTGRLLHQLAESGYVREPRSVIEPSTENKAVPEQDGEEQKGKIDPC